MDDSFSEAAFVDFFTPKRPMLKEEDVWSESVSCLTSVLNVLTVKASLHYFFYEGCILPLEPFRRFLRSQKGLKNIEFLSTGQCICHSHRNRPAELLEAHGHEMGMSWVAIIIACFENPSLESVKCYCSCSKILSLSAEDIASSLTLPPGRDNSISICGWKIQGEARTIS